MKTTDKQGCNALVEILVKQGVKRAVLSPGSRNAPVLMAFSRCEAIESYVVVDERTAAFMALGMSQRSGEPVALVCHEEGKLLGLPLNRALYDEETGAVYDVIAGTFFLCGAPPEEEHFGSLTEPQIAWLSRRFARPELFWKMGERLLVFPTEGGR